MAPLSRLLKRPIQIYISRSRDPFLNLSIEHHFLQKSSPESVVLFLYTNRPCVVIGRNQNPWREVNLGLINRPGTGLIRPASSSSNNFRYGLQASIAPSLFGSSSSAVPGTADDDRVLLVRRRSGGGAVFHDEGNVNYSVICPPPDFGRNKHAELVVRALQSLGARSTRVNDRHDIVMDVGSETRKISGSAYKLTRLRALHHGTCLLSSPNLGKISQFLHSPAEPYIHARGVESVRSKIGNVGVDNKAFEEAVVVEFADMYEDVEPEIITEEGAKEEPEIVKGYEELKSRDWIYKNTPQFTFSTQPVDGESKERPPLPEYLPKDFEASITSRHAEISHAEVSGLSAPLESKLLQEVTDWRTLVGEAGGTWLNNMFGVQLER